MNTRRIFRICFAAAFAVVAAFAVLYFLDSREEYEKLKLTEAKNRRRLDEVTRQLHEQETILQRLRTDPAYVEKIIRRKLGYAKPDETIFRFED